MTTYSLRLCFTRVSLVSKAIMPAVEMISHVGEGLCCETHGIQRLALSSGIYPKSSPDEQ
jgi:hypothetical protein